MTRHTLSSPHPQVAAAGATGHRAEGRIRRAKGPIPPRRETATARSAPATSSAAFPTSGRRGLVTQSGCLGLAALTLLTGPSPGVGGFVSVGNTADLTPNNLLLVSQIDSMGDNRPSTVKPGSFCGGADATAKAAGTAAPPQARSYYSRSRFRTRTWPLTDKLPTRACPARGLAPAPGWPMTPARDGADHPHRPCKRCGGLGARIRIISNVYAQ
jgi:hypothetical protein